MAMPGGPMAGLRVPVFVEGWQIECCGTPPALGDRVDWSLLLVDRQPGTAPDPAADVTLDAVVTRLAVPVPPDPQFSGPAEPAWTEVTLLTTGGLRAYWPDAGGATGPLRVSGRLLEDHHGAVPPGTSVTCGTVVRVRIATTHHTWEPDGRIYGFGPGATRYRDVGRGPASFGSPPPADDVLEFWEETGVLVDLIVQAGA